MTIVVAVKVTDGVVLAADSATTFMDSNGVPVKVYNNANKIFNLVKGLSLGAMTFGSGSIGPASIATLSKDLRKEFSIKTSPYYFDQDNYTVEDVAKKCQAFFQDKFKQQYPEGAPNFHMGYRVIGYGTNDVLSSGWDVQINDAQVPPEAFMNVDGFGSRWAGDGEALDRLVLGRSSKIYETLLANGLEPSAVDSLDTAIIEGAYQNLFLPAMPIQDAIELARFMAETAAKFSLFSLRAATIGGPIEIATITKHEGFKWVHRKHYFSEAFN